MSQFREIQPVAQREIYSPGDTLDFLVNTPGMEVLQNSFSISGKLIVIADNTDPDNPVEVADGDDIQFDHWSGIHAFFSDISASVNDYQLVESVHHLGRWEKMKTMTSQTDVQLGTQLTNLMELKCSDDLQSTQIMRGQVVGDPEISFNFKPNFSLNGSNIPLANSKVGQIRISLRLSTVEDCLFGVTNANVRTYYMSNIKLNYRVQPESGVKGPLTVPITGVARYTVEATRLNSITLTTPISCSQIAMTFERNIDLNDKEASNNQTVKPDQMESITWYVNDENQVFSFTLDDQEEILYNYVLSMNGKITNNSIKLANVEDRYGVGLRLNKLYPPQSKFSVDIVAQPEEKMTAYAFFTGLVSI